MFHVLQVQDGEWKQVIKLDDETGLTWKLEHRGWLEIKTGTYTTSGDIRFDDPFRVRITSTDVTKVGGFS